MILYNGIPLIEDFEQVKDGAEGVARGREEALKNAPKKGYVLIGVAGMGYAAAVESYGKDVITGSSQIVEEWLKNALKNLKSKSMRKTAPEVVTDLYKLVKASAINASVTSNIFKYERPLNFQGECIVINALPLTTGQLQMGILNLNHFVPNLENTTVNPVDKTQPDSARLEAGSKIIDDVLKHYWGQDFLFEVQQTTLMSNDAKYEWYNNFRIAIRNVNI